MLAKCCWEQLRHKLTVLAEQFAVDRDFAARTKIANHIPVQCGFLDPACFGITLTRSEVNGTAYFFVKTDFFRLETIS
jgi:hypothetical protein